MNEQRQRIIITGSVQGVGFRPFVYNLAIRYNLVGFIHNNSQGVIIELQGQEDMLDSFVNALQRERPRLAEPEIVSREIIPTVAGERNFSIAASEHTTSKKMVFTPDSATCEDCLRELHNPADRRFRYPFINCTNCGPRYTIIFDVPYDRPNTTMRSFRMCPLCQKEYENPADRRFHAQPNACPVCGPYVWLTDANGKKIETEDALKYTVGLLEAGAIIAIKGLGGFHLACRADSAEVVAALRQRKYRKAKSFAVMVRDINAAEQIAEISKTAEKLLTGVERPIVLCPKKANTLNRQVAPSSLFWGIMLPYTPLHTLIMEGRFPALVMTSGNNSDEPIECDNDRALVRLAGIADYFLLHNRDIYTSCDDSVVGVFRDKEVIFRRGRGYVPRPLRIARQGSKDILAVGAELKNSVTVLKNDEAFISQHIGDLQGAATYESFRRTIEKFLVLLDVQPQIIACDLHPAMSSTRWAEKYSHCRLVRVQHHHAHIAAVMGEYDLAGPVIGIAADGLGYGSDGTIWGCECLVVWRDNFRRWGHLQAIPTPGGDAASRQPWRMAISYLYHTFGEQKTLDFTARYFDTLDQQDIATILQMCRRGINSPLSSGLGRFFDGVSALLGVCRDNTYDAQAPIELENIANYANGEKNLYPVNLQTIDRQIVVMVKPIIHALIQDLQAAVEPAIIAARFHNTIIAALFELGRTAARQIDSRIIVLGGGSFQNNILLNGLYDLFNHNGFQVYFSRRVPLNDGGISFGQAIVADAITS